MATRMRPLALAAMALTLAFAPSCAEREDTEVEDEAFLTADTGEVADEPADGDSIAGTNWTRRDWEILEEKVRWAEAEGLAELPVGEALARLGETFVGTTYTPQTLEAEGAEHLVINLRELDCVTFIENMLALTWFIRSEGSEALSDPEDARRRYERYLTAVRYRDGVIDGYPSRLHYFTDWLRNNDAMGLIELRTRELDGAVPDNEPIDFMTEHRDAYRQLAEEVNFGAIGEVEARLTAENPRYYIPQDRIGEVADQIADGDIIAATSTVEGLDVAHTGIALWQDGRLHLLHAPLVGKDVEISELPLAERIVEISGQDGIMVARPLEWPGSSLAERRDGTAPPPAN